MAATDTRVPLITGSPPTTLGTRTIRGNVAVSEVATSPPRESLGHLCRSPVSLPVYQAGLHLDTRGGSPSRFLDHLKRITGLTLDDFDAALGDYLREGT